MDLRGKPKHSSLPNYDKHLQMDTKTNNFKNLAQRRLRKFLEDNLRDRESNVF